MVGDDLTRCPGPVVPSLIRLFFTCTTLALVASLGCVGSRQHVAACAPPGVCCQDVLFVADGAGDFRVTSLNVDRVIHGEQMPFCMTTVNWSHGYARVLADHLDLEHAKAEGQVLAQQIRERKACGPCRIYVIAHSAGSVVVLVAAEHVEPNTIERIVLLAPSVRADYDLRPVLRGTRGGIDCYYSSHRDMYVRWAAILSRMCRGEPCPRAGQNGFQPVIECDEDAALYGKLYQIPWERSFAHMGNRGGHYGAYQPCFLKDYVLPLMQRPADALPPGIAYPQTTFTGSVMRP